MAAEDQPRHVPHWVAAGDAPPAVLVHCTLAHGGEWKGIARHLPGRRLVAPDLPGHGRNPPWAPADGDLHDLATRGIRAVVEAEGPPVHLVGHSFGATVALRLALEAPDLVRSLVLIEPVLFALVRPEGRDAANRGFEAAWATGDREATARAFLSVWGAGPAWEDLPERQRAYLRDRIHLVPGQNSVLHHDRPGLLRPGRMEALRCPVLLVDGGDSPAVAGEITARLAERLPAARRITVPGAGHMLPVTHAEALASAIADFWAAGA